MRSSAAALLALMTAAGAGVAPAADIQFRHIAFDTPLEVKPRAGEGSTPAVRRFLASGKNPYAGDAQAIDAGRRLYEEFCQSCHLPDGSGRIGPSLVSGEPIYPRNRTDVGLFETIYGGAMGAMQSFRERMTQDEILKLVAYVRKLQARANRR